MRHSGRTDLAAVAAALSFALGCGGASQSAPPPACVSDAACDDGLFCNGVETCGLTGCQAGTPVACDDAVACTVDACDEAANACTHTASNAACDDGLFCNGVETCGLTGCQTATPVVCDDAVACTVDACDEGANACTHMASNAACDDGLFCNGVETCGLTGCQAGTPVVCDDAVACTVDRCDESARACTHDAADAVVHALDVDGKLLAFESPPPR